MAFLLTLTITVQDADALRVALDEIADAAEDQDYQAQGIADHFASGYSEGGWTVAAEVEEVPS